MKNYSKPIIRAFWWSLALALLANHVVALFNPFQGLVLLIILLIAVLVQVVMLRKRGLTYIGTFFVGVGVLTVALIYLDNALFAGPRRYYGVNNLR